MGFIDNILNEWAHRTKTGSPNVHDKEDLKHLVAALFEMNMSEDFINEFVGNIIEDKEEQDRIDARHAERVKEKEHEYLCR